MLIPNWKTVLTRAWSVWAAAAATFFGALEAALALLTADHLGIPQGTFASLSALTSAAAVFFRLLSQQGITPHPANNQEQDQ
jgi:hypothetical protein